MQTIERRSAKLSKQALNVSSLGEGPGREDTLRSRAPGNKSHKPLEESIPAASEGIQRSRDLLNAGQPTKEPLALRECILLLLLTGVTLGFSFLQPKTFLTINRLISVIGSGK